MCYSIFVPQDAPILRYSTCKYTVTLKPRLGSLKVIGTDIYRSATYDFLLMFHTMGLSRIISEINGESNFAKKIPTPVYFAPLLTWFPLELGIGAWNQKKLEWWGYQTALVKKTFKIGLVVWTQCRRVTDRQTDWYTDILRQQRPSYADRRAGKNLCIAEMAYRAKFASTSACVKRYEHAYRVGETIYHFRDRDRVPSGE